jgi:hypothetical protein
MPGNQGPLPCFIRYYRIEETVKHEQSYGAAYAILLPGGD